MKLLPDIVFDYDKYWQSVSSYNIWFIKLRNYAVVLLSIFILSLAFILQIKLNPFQIFGLTGATVFIFSYNQLFKRQTKKLGDKSTGSKPLRISLIQIILDLISLSFIVYITGGVEAPLFLFFIFHMIIGSIILPDKIIYLIAAVLVTLFGIFSTLEFYHVIPHNGLTGFYQNSLYTDANFVFGFLLTFAFALFISIYLTNKVVRDLYRRERELKIALEELHEAEASKQKYIIAVVHELKSPLVAAISYLELLTGGFVGNISKDVNDKISKAKVRLSEAIGNINNILHVSKFKLLNKIDKAKVDIHDMIKLILESSSAVAERKNIKLTFTDKRINQSAVEGDKLLLHLAFSNIISNALKYTDINGRIIVEIIGDANNTKIIVSDDGIGIPEEEQMKVFDEYYRASNIGNRIIEGTGTGLSLVKQIIDAHNGIIKVSSPSELKQPNRPGTSFETTLS